MERLQARQRIRLVCTRVIVLLKPIDSPRMLRDFPVLTSVVASDRQQTCLIGGRNGCGGIEHIEFLVGVAYMC